MEQESFKPWLSEQYWQEETVNVWSGFMQGSSRSPSMVSLNVPGYMSSFHHYVRIINRTTIDTNVRNHAASCALNYVTKRAGACIAALYSLL